MATTRRFCRFSRSLDSNPHGALWGEASGFCLSSFLVIRTADRPRSILLGKMNPHAPWDHLGGLDPARVEAHRHGWVLPASQLLLREGPSDAKDRIVREQLGDLPVRWSAPQIVSEVYAPKRFPQLGDHWDLEFLYAGESSGPAPELPAIWSELRFIDLRTIEPSEFARSHEEVLTSAGLAVGNALGVSPGGGKASGTGQI